MEKMYNYTVCFLIDPAMQQVLLCMKGKTSFKGRLNGVGGEFQPGESAIDCAIREIKEETGYMLKPEQLIPLGILSLEDCKHDISANCVLHVYAAQVDKNTCNRTENDAGELLFWCSLGRILNRPVTSRTIAGDGDVLFFLNRAVHKLGIEVESDASEPTPALPPMSEKAMHKHVANYLANDLGFNKGAVQAMVSRQVDQFNIRHMVEEAINQLLPKPKLGQTYETMLTQMVQEEIRTQLKACIDTGTKMKLTKAASEYTDQLVNNLMKRQDS